ncbi:HGGxSTG domain-containing protein [Lysobacter niastensis]|uniref:HGGxSTG domain-containing protein n=1 Tax=Lysobacter niastensis TaxID=380629 RepID=UPI003D2F7440
MMGDGYLSKNRAHLARLQRKRRAGMIRIDYMPGPEALAIIKAKRATVRRGSAAATNSAVIDAIVAEWAVLAGINKGGIERPMTSAEAAGICQPFRARAYDFDANLPSWAATWLAHNRAKQSARRVVCGARRHRDGRPCQAKSEPGKRRCRFHGGRSTGPRTAEGKTRALANLKQNRSATVRAGSGYTPAC